MAEMFGGFAALGREILSDPVVCFCVVLPLLILPFSILGRLLVNVVGHDFHVDCSGLFEWIYDRFVDLLKKLFGFEFIFKHGLARPGVDFVECDSCFCSECNFRDQCPEERRAEMAAMKGEDLSDG